MPKHRKVTSTKCAECGADVSKRHIEFNAALEVVCMACYLRNPPQEDIDCAIAGIAIATAAESSLRRQLRPQKLSKDEYAESRRFIDMCMGRTAAPRKEARRG